MKKILMVIAAVAVLQTVAYAQSIDFSGDVTGGKSVEVTNLENGYYDLTAVCKNTSEEGVKVTVRGIEVENGKCTIGVGTDGNGVIEISDVDLVKTDKQNGFIQGGDMTEVDYIESLGGEYKDSDGNKVDPFEFLSQNGMNMARIRLSNTPGKGTGDGVYYLPSGFQDEKERTQVWEYSSRLIIPIIGRTAQDRLFRPNGLSRLKTSLAMTLRMRTF